MRWVGILMIAGACGAAPPAERLPVPVVARGEVPAPPMPAFGGVRRTGRCAIYLARADDREVERRESAIRARLPAGATFELSPFGDRATRVSIPIARASMKKAKPTIAMARAFVRDTAEVWDIVPELRMVGRAERVDRDRWAIEFEVSLNAQAEWDHSEHLIVVQVDGRRGLLQAAYVRVPAPGVKVCDGPQPPFDRDRVRAAARGRYAEEDVGEPVPWLLANEPVVRWVAAVPVGRGQGAVARAADRMVREAAVEKLVLVDPDTFEVLGSAPAPTNMPYDPWYSPASDARGAFDP